MNYESDSFTNYSKIGKECPRCGEENDKCGVFEESNLVMCRTDMGDSIEPRLDANGWEYWAYMVGTGDKFHEIYNMFSNAMALSPDDNQAFLARGFTPEQIVQNGYKSVPHRTGSEGLNQIIEIIDGKVELKDVPGFFINEGKRDANIQYKQTIIPVRNFAGRISQFVLRNNGATSKKKSKYIMFSSDSKDEGAKTDQQVHFPIGHEQCGHEIRVTEGIIKADAATAIGDIYCLGLHGLSSRGLIPAIEMLGVSKIRLCLDIDWQDNHNVLNGLRRIYTSICNAGFEVVVEEWNAEDGKGIDDVLLSKGRTWNLTKEEIEYLLDCPKFDRADWIFVNKTSQFAKIDVSPIKIMDEKHFNNHFAKHKDEFAKQAKTMVQQCDSFTYLPLQEMTALEGSFFNLNTWRDTGIGIDKADGDLTVFFDHLDYLFPGEDEQKNMVLDWMANIVQHRGKKFSYSLVVHGEEGTGKTWMIHCLSLILGLDNVGVIGNDYIGGDFTSMMESKELLIVDEVMSAGRINFMNKMKPYIDRNTLTMNKKSIPEYEMPFKTNWFMTTNYDDALYLDDKDRRYNVVSSPAICGDDSSADKRGAVLFRWSGGGKEEFPIQEGNIGALHKYLMERKVKYRPFAKAPLTRAKIHMQEESLGVFEKFVKERIEEQMWPFNTDLVCIEHIKMLPAIEKRFEKVSPHKWANVLKRFGAAQYGYSIAENGSIVHGEARKVRMEKGKQRRVWVVRRHEMYCDLASPKISELYLEKKTGQVETPSDSGMEQEPI